MKVHHVNKVPIESKTSVDIFKRNGCIGKGDEPVLEILVSHFTWETPVLLILEMNSFFMKPTSGKWLKIEADTVFMNRILDMWLPIKRRQLKFACVSIQLRATREIFDRTAIIFSSFSQKTYSRCFPEGLLIGSNEESTYRKKKHCYKISIKYLSEPFKCLFRTKYSIYLITNYPHQELNIFIHSLFFFHHVLSDILGLLMKWRIQNVWFWKSRINL